MKKVELVTVTIDGDMYLCEVKEPADENKPRARTRVLNAVEYSDTFEETVDKWLCKNNLGELIKFTVGVNQGYRTEELQEKQKIVLQQKFDFMDTIIKQALARVYNGQYMQYKRD